MPANTGIAALPYPLDTEPVNLGAANIQALARALETMLVPRFATTADRTTAWPSPPSGALSWRNDSGTGSLGALEQYQTGAWRGLLLTSGATLTATTNGSGNINGIAHNLPAAPRSIVTATTPSGAGVTGRALPTSITATTFAVTVVTSTAGAIVANTGIVFSWIALL